MSKNNIYDRVLMVVKGVVDDSSKEKINLNTILNLSGISSSDIEKAESVYPLDSLQIAELIVSLEQEFKIEISDEFMSDFRTVKDLVDEVTRSL